MNPMMPAPQPTGGYNFQQAPAGVMTIPPALSGGYYNQMAQMMAGPNYQMPHFAFTGLNALNGGQQIPSGGPPPHQNPQGGYTNAGGFDNSGSYNFQGLGGNNDFFGPSNYGGGVMNLGGGQITGGYSPSSNGLGGIVGGMLGGSLAGLPGMLAGRSLGGMFGNGSSTLTLPDGTQLPTQNMNLPPTVINLPNQNINLAKPLIYKDTGVPVGTGYWETPQAQQDAAQLNMGLNQFFSNSNPGGSGWAAGGGRGEEPPPRGSGAGFRRSATGSAGILRKS